ncbi:MAG: hypothetical protein ACW98K_17230 [Candidatus Kariarchaeaceae archaeon]|jgi:hypothetical protein
MSSELIKLLRNQFGLFIRGTSYGNAFEHSIRVLQDLKIEPSGKSRPDTFYLFLHALVISMFNKLDDLEERMVKLQQDT